MIHDVSSGVDFGRVGREESASVDRRISTLRARVARDPADVESRILHAEELETYGLLQEARTQLVEGLQANPLDSRLHSACASFLARVDKDARMGPSGPKIIPVGRLKLKRPP